MADDAVNILGAGLCGSLLSIILANRGIESCVYER
jgi:flavin-dependent dehydrogenase